jgi:hypothetical protein
MYPCAMTKNSVAACPDATKFAYKITSVEVTT